MMPPTASRHVPTLDGIRGLALLLVLVGHYLDFRYFAWGGVYLFFALSGYLITGLLVRELERSGQIAFRRFYVRRILRLAPAYLLWLAVTVAVLATHMTARDWGELGALVLYLGNYYQLLDAGPARLSADPWPFAAMVRHGWSLSVEEQFYLLWPVVLLALGRHPRAAKVLLLITAVLLTWRLGAPALLSPRYARRAFETNAAWLALGCTLALYRVSVPPLVRVRWLEWIGRVSYPAYLWHIWAWYLGLRLAPGASGLLLATGVTFALAAASTYWLEQPILHWRDGRWPTITPLPQIPVRRRLPVH